MKISKVFKFGSLVICFLVLFSTYVIEEAYAERFFKKHNTWYEKIPANPTLRANSANYVADIITNAKRMYGNSSGWSVPIFHAAGDTPNTTVTIWNELPGQKDYIEAQGWNVVPIPDGALPAMNTERCAGQYTDGHMVVISADGLSSWDFLMASKCNGTWSARTVRKQDLTGDGINSPYDYHGMLRMTSVPLLHGLITYDEVVNDGVIDHALAFAYNAVKIAEHWQLYPSEHYSGGSSSRTWALLGGERIFLDASVDCTSLGLNSFGVMVCVALQQYGMIFVENTSLNNNYVFMEHLDDQPSKSWSGIYKSLSAIPLNKLRVIKPLKPPFNIPPPTYQCSDGKDNDGDGLKDYHNDPGCDSATDNDEYNAPSDIAPDPPTGVTVQ